MVHIRFNNPNHIRFNNPKKMKNMKKLKKKRKYTAIIRSSTLKSVNYSTSIGEKPSCTCKYSHFNPRAICKHMKKLKKTTRVCKKDSVCVVCIGNTSFASVKSSDGTDNYTTSVGRYENCTCKSKYYNPKHECKHQKILHNKVSEVTKKGVLAYACTI